MREQERVGRLVCFPARVAEIRTPRLSPLMLVGDQTLSFRLVKQGHTFNIRSTGGTVDGSENHQKKCYIHLKKVFPVFREGRARCS